MYTYFVLRTSEGLEMSYFLFWLFRIVVLSVSQLATTTEGSTQYSNME